MNGDILIVDDEEDIRHLIQGILDDEGYRTRTASSSKSAYKAIEESLPDLIVLDIWLQGSEHDGIEILDNIKAQHPNTPVIMISGHGTIETAVSSIKQGAYDFIEKPFKSDRLILMIQRAIETANLRMENEALKEKVDSSFKFIGKCASTKNFLQVLKRAAPTNSRILLTGEPGSGKELSARYIHENSARNKMPFMVLSCANLRPDSLEAELFGSEERLGGYIGILEKANGGTLLLDEVSDMPLETQGKIVRVLQNQNFKKLGGDKSIDVDVRIIASTNKNLEDEIEAGNFREDLYYRLNVVPIHVLPLRERIDDISDIVDYYSSVLAKSFGVNKPVFNSEALGAFQIYKWPGNIRQLRNTIEWVMIMSGAKDSYGIDNLPSEISGIDTVSDLSTDNDETQQIPYHLSKLSLRDAREHFERLYLQNQIERFEGNVSKTAQFIGMERSALHRKLKSLGIMPNANKNTDEPETLSKQKRA